MPRQLLIISLLSQSDIDKLISVVVLAKLLSKHSDKVSIYPGKEAIPVGLEKVVSPQGVTFLEKLTGDYTSITLNKKGTQIKNVRWEESGDKVKILVFTEKGELDTKEYMVDPGKAHFDQAYAVGFSNLATVESTLGDQANLWKAAETFNLDKVSNNENFALHNNIYPEAGSYAELVMRYANAKSLNISSQEATELLSAIYWKTDSLRNEFTGSVTFDAVSQLLNWGASLEVVNKTIFSINKTHVRALQQIYQNVHYINSFAFSTVDVEIAKELRAGLQVYPERNPLGMLDDSKVSFVILPIENNQSLVYAVSRDPQLKMTKVFNKYKYRGSNSQGSFKLQGNPTSAEAEILNIIKNGNNTSQPGTPAATVSPIPATLSVLEKEKQVAAINNVKTTQPVENVQPIVEDPLKPASEVFTPAKNEDANGNQPGFNQGIPDPLPKHQESNPA